MNRLRSYLPKVASGLAIAAVAITAGVISFSHIYDLSIALHQGVLAARLMPVGIDGLVVVGSVVLLQGGRLGWLGIGPGVGISLFANIESGLRYGALAAIWAGIPALSFFLASYILERWLQGQAKAPSGAPLEAMESTPEPIAMDAPESATTVTPESPSEITPRSAESAPIRTVRRAPRRPKGATPESVYAALLATGKLPSIRAIRRDMHVGDAKAKTIREQLAEVLKNRAPVAA